MNLVYLNFSGCSYLINAVRGDTVVQYTTNAALHMNHKYTFACVMQIKLDLSRSASDGNYDYII